MDILDNGILLFAKLIRENQYLIKCFLSNYGVFSGVFRNYSDRRKNPNFQLIPGTLFKAKWNARLGEHLGSYRLEHHIPNLIPNLLLERRKHGLLLNSVELINIYLPEREKQTSLWFIALYFLQCLTLPPQKALALAHLKQEQDPDQENITQLFGYFLLEFKLLEEIGLSITNLLPNFSENGKIFLSVVQEILKSITQRTSTIPEEDQNSLSLLTPLMHANATDISLGLEKTLRLLGNNDLFEELLRKAFKLNGKLFARVVQHINWLQQRTLLLEFSNPPLF